MPSSSSPASRNSGRPPPPPGWQCCDEIPGRSCDFCLLKVYYVKYLPLFPLQFYLADLV